MATKKATLELDAYEKLRTARRSRRESFSQVVRRAVFRPTPHPGAAILAAVGSWSPCQGNAVAEALAYVERALREDSARPRVSPSAWGKTAAGGDA